jgi:hypothetical protein
MLPADREELRRRAEARGGTGASRWCREVGRLPAYDEPQPAVFSRRVARVTGSPARSVAVVPPPSTGTASPDSSVTVVWSDPMATVKRRPW